jgi:membrane-bound lytic murein transglycosylase F
MKKLHRNKRPKVRTQSKAVRLRQRLKVKARHVRFAVGGLVAVTSLALQPTMTALQSVRTSGELHLVGITSPSTFIHQNGHTHGMQYELARQFAEELGVELVIDPVDTTEGVLKSIQRNQAQLALTGLTTSDPRLGRLMVSDPVIAVSQQLIHHTSQRAPRSVEDLSGKTIATIADSTEALTLKSSLSGIKDVRIVEFRNAQAKDLLNLLNDQKVDLVAMHSQDFDSHRPLYPQLAEAIDLNQADAMAWVFLKSQDQSLYQAAQNFLARKKADGSLERLAQFYSTGKSFNRYGNNVFNRDVAQRLPRYQDAFQRQAAKEDLDWQLLAAISYQESKWDPNAVSPTGVRGLMMLTNATARAMGVRDRTNPEQSIKGGAAYIKQVLNNIPDSVPQPDRTWMALAGYNMGPAHVNAARRLTARLGQNPDSWQDVAANLPRLVQENRANGRAVPDIRQALHYVQQIRRYYDAIALSTAESREPAQVADMNFRITTPDG